MPPKTAPLHHHARIHARPPHAGPGQAIGLLGGSFDPPHVAHRLISETALKRARLDKVWWIVSPGNPLKRRRPPAPLAERMQLCRAMAANPHIVVTDFEADLPTPYTASTLAFLKARNPLVHYVWIMGADNLANFHHWARWREIFTMVPVVVVDRPGWRMKALASKAARTFARSRRPEADAALVPHMPPPAWTFLTGPLSHASSTAIRNRAKARQQPQGAKRAAPPPEPLPWRKAKAAPQEATEAEMQACEGRVPLQNGGGLENVKP